MSSLPGNICLVLAALVFSPVFTPLFHSKISTSNDQGASGFMLIFVLLIHLLFLGLVFFTALSIGRHGGFDWISQKSFLRIGLVGIGLLSMVIVSAISVMVRFTDTSGPAMLESLIKIAPTIIFIVVIGAGFILNNEMLSSSIPIVLYKIPLALVSFVCLAGLAYVGISAAATGSVGLEDSTRQYENAPSIKASRISEIEETDINENFTRILGFTGGLYPIDVREKAAAKIKTHSDYQNELIKLLKSDNPIDALGFLSLSEVDDKTLFPEAVNTGILNTAAWIRHSIQGTSPSEFYTDRYSVEVSSALKTADKYEEMGIDFLPAVKELRDALDEPFGGKKVNYDCSPGIEEWIKNHS